jgi:hypothetical protein
MPDDGREKMKRENFFFQELDTANQFSDYSGIAGNLPELGYSFPPDQPVSSFRKQAMLTTFFNIPGCSS